LADVSVPLQEEERAAWSRLIRVLGHELSNSLAPIKSIAGSLRARVDTLQGSGPTSADFHRGLGIIESRADSLHRFVQSYRMLAQLPPPRLQAFSLGPLRCRVVDAAGIGPFRHFDACVIHQAQTIVAVEGEEWSMHHLENAGEQGCSLQRTHALPLQQVGKSIDLSGELP